MATTGVRLIISLLFVGALYTSVDAAVSAWTEPNAAGANVSAAATATIAESLANGASTGVTIAATTDNSGTISFAISSQPTAGKLTIDSDTGVLTLAVGTFDFETESTYILVIVATDTDTKTGTATVTLSITDVNDESPTFAHAQYSATVPDASTGGTSVTTVSASDVDTGDSITYSITGGNTNTDFAIGDTTGAITVATGQTVAADTLAAYTLTVTATDAASHTTTTTVSIAVKDVANSGDGTTPIVNKSGPVFSASYSPCIADKSPADTSLTTVTATVKDTSDTLTYAITTGNTGSDFRIDTNSGLIQVNTAKALDKAKTSSYIIVVTATTTVAPLKTATTTVSVTVADSCDSGTAVVSVSMVMLVVSLFVTLF